MRKRVGLLTRKDKTERFHTPQSGIVVHVTHLMALPFSHQFGGAMQALFGLDHLASGKSILAASVLAEFDQIPSLCRCANFAMSRRVKVDC